GVLDTAAALRFSVDIPQSGPPPKLAGFLVNTAVPVGLTFNWQVTDLRADTTTIDLSAERWQGHNGRGARAELTPERGQVALSYLGAAVDYLAAEPVQLVIAPPVPATPVPVLASSAALAALRLPPGADSRLPFGPGPVNVRVTGAVAAVPAVSEPAGLLVDLPSLTTALFHTYGVVPDPQEWWVSTTAGAHAAAAGAAGRLGGLEIHDRRSIAERAGREPYGAGARLALFAAALGAVLLAAVGLTVDVRATARRRATELAVLHTLGAGPRLLARSLVTEHGFLAAVGVLAGVGLGIGVAATMAPLVILTPNGARPLPPALLAVPWPQVALSAAAVLLLAAALAAAVAATLRSRLAATRLRIGADR
ncbi:MAG TPA: FtsX-like permease family protein, partial [Catenuloplanes sp.]